MPALAVFAQVVPAATDNHLQLKIGAGFSDYSGDLNNGQLQGGALWIDGAPPNLPHFLHGWALEIEWAVQQQMFTALEKYGILPRNSTGEGDQPLR